MLVSDLVVYDLVPSELAALRQIMPDRLLPLQEQAVRRGILHPPSDLVIAGPPNSGKSALLELVALHATHSGLRPIVVAIRSAYKFDWLRPLPIAQNEFKNLDDLVSADVILVDDLECLEDAAYRPALFRLLSWIKLLKERRRGGPQLIASSRPFAGITALAARIGAELVADSKSEPREKIDQKVLAVLSAVRAKKSTLSAAMPDVQEGRR